MRAPSLLNQDLQPPNTQRGLPLSMRTESRGVNGPARLCVPGLVVHQIHHERWSSENSHKCWMIRARKRSRGLPFWKRSFCNPAPARPIRHRAVLWLVRSTATALFDNFHNTRLLAAIHACRQTDRPRGKPREYDDQSCKKSGHRINPTTSGVNSRDLYPIPTQTNQIRRPKGRKPVPIHRQGTAQNRQLCPDR